LAKTSSARRLIDRLRIRFAWRSRPLYEEVHGSDDNGGVHTNSLIASHAFYLAIEGGTKPHSGLSVTGVGSANREQIEKVFYRAFAF
jgi:Zn-dependent metalloprotease